MASNENPTLCPECAKAPEHLRRCEAHGHVFVYTSLGLATACSGDGRRAVKMDREWSDARGWNR